MTLCSGKRVSIHISLQVLSLSLVFQWRIWNGWVTLCLKKWNIYWCSRWCHGISLITFGTVTTIVLQYCCCIFPYDFMSIFLLVCVRWRHFSFHCCPKDFDVIYVVELEELSVIKFLLNLGCNVSWYFSIQIEMACFPNSWGYCCIGLWRQMSPWVCRNQFIWYGV